MPLQMHKAGLALSLAVDSAGLILFYSLFVHVYRNSPELCSCARINKVIEYIFILLSGDANNDTRVQCSSVATPGNPYTLQ